MTAPDVNADVRARFERDYLARYPNADLSMLGKDDFGHYRREQVAQQWRGYRATLADMAKRLEAAERDARRYRWLRDKAWSMPAIAQQELPAVAIFSGSGRRCKDVSGEEMDAAIDAAQEGEG